MSFENERYVSNRVDRIKKLEEENAKLRETIIELCQYHTYGLNDNDEFFVCDCKGHLMARKVLEKTNE